MSVDEVDKLTDRASSLGENAAGVEAAERAVRQADLVDYLAWQRYARSLLIRLATFGGFPEKALVAFSWSLAKLDREPSEKWTRNLLWKYKWILRSLAESLEFSIEQRDGAYHDALRRFAEAGFSARPVVMHRAREMSYRGRSDEAAEIMARALALPRDEVSDCRACEPGFAARICCLDRDWQGALEATTPVLEGGHTCAEQPELTHALVLQPLCELGRLEEAIRYHRLSFARTLDLCCVGDSVADHILFLVRTENHGRAVDAFSTYWGKTLSETPHERFRFAVAVALLLHDLVDDPRGVRFNVRIPRQHPLHGITSGKDIAELASHFDAESLRLASRFDQRHGNQRYAHEIRDCANDVARRLPFAI